jgi:hypothetical protein
MGFDVPQRATKRLTVIVTVTLMCAVLCCAVMCCGVLQVKNAAGQWVDAPPLPGTFVCNIGDCFEVRNQQQQQQPSINVTPVAIQHVKLMPALH